MGAGLNIGLIDVDGHNFPNLPLMKLSAWHKQQGDTVVWYEPLLHGFPNNPLDKVYISKVFSFTPDYSYHVNAKEVIKGGSGYCISLVDGIEIFDKSKEIELPKEIETIYPDYRIYYEKIPEVRNTAYGFLTRGCPYGYNPNNPINDNAHNYCHVSVKEGFCSHKVANLNSFWRGQKNIVLLDANITVCKEWKELFQQLVDSKAWIDFSQGLDIHVMTEEKAEMIKQMNVNNIHFAWDRYRDKSLVLPRFKMFKEITGLGYQNLTVYMLTNFDTSIEEDLERIYTLRDLGFNPYVMIYNKNEFVDCDKNGKPVKLKPENVLLEKYSKERIEHFNVCWKIQRWVNNRIIFRSCHKFEEYDQSRRKGKAG
ncbi:radical SAM protein [bacterium D16-51]|nr:radical SAM protein [bacterium D16-59]RKI54421.1 radical SAM protein [bacterium D16-51]